MELIKYTKTTKIDYFLGCTTKNDYNLYKSSFEDTDYNGDDYNPEWAASSLPQNMRSTLQFFVHQTDKHLLSIAPTRTGKGRGLILPNLLNLPEHSIFVIDPKGENALVSARYREKIGHKIVIFNPYRFHFDEFEKRGFTQFQNFNPLASLKHDSDDFADDVAVIAEALIYETGGDSHWTEAAKGLIEFLITYLVTEPKEAKTRTFRRLRQIIAGGKDSIGKIIPDCEKHEAHYLVKENVGRYMSVSNKVSSLIATAETQTRIFKSKKICDALAGDSFDFGRMKDTKIAVYLILPSERLITQVRYLRLILLIATSQFLRSEKGNHQVLMVMDEFANLGALKTIENGYGLIAGHGVTLWSFVQNLTQLKNLYPKNWEVFIANSAVVTVSNVNDVTTAEYFNRRAGKYEKVKINLAEGQSVGHMNVSKSSSDTKSWVWEDRLPVSKLYNAKPNTIFIFHEGRASPLICNKVRYNKDEPFMERADENPMYVPM
jgi:type IV secretion system protein VirD4